MSGSEYLRGRREALEELRDWLGSDDEYDALGAIHKSLAANPQLVPERDVPLRLLKALRDAVERFALAADHFAHRFQEPEPNALISRPQPVGSGGEDGGEADALPLKWEDGTPESLLRELREIHTLAGGLHIEDPVMAVRRLKGMRTAALAQHDEARKTLAAADVLVESMREERDSRLTREAAECLPRWTGGYYLASHERDGEYIDLRDLRAAFGEDEPSKGGDGS